MSLSLAIALIVLLDLALLTGLAYVMSGARLLTPHASSTAAALAPQPAAARKSATTRRAARVSTRAIGVEG